MPLNVNIQSYNTILNFVCVCLCVWGGVLGVGVCVCTDTCYRVHLEVRGQRTTFRK